MFRFYASCTSTNKGISLLLILVFTLSLILDHGSYNSLVFFRTNNGSHVTNGTNSYPTGNPQQVTFDYGNDLEDNANITGNDSEYPSEGDGRGKVVHISTSLRPTAITIRTRATNAPTATTTVTEAAATTPSTQTAKIPGKKQATKFTIKSIVKSTANSTTKPTTNPTTNPTENPTRNPTTNPTENPTTNPTGKPTVTPTVKPTVSPTVKPTGKTATPTVAPTAIPEAIQIPKDSETETGDLIQVHEFAPVEHTIRYDGVEGMKTLMARYFSINLCGAFIDNPRLRISERDTNTISAFDHLPTTSLTVSFPCNELFHKSAYGTGNFILLLYMLRMQARQLGNIDVSFSCPDAELYKDQLILPWLMGNFSRTVWDSSTYPASARTNPTIVEACNSYSISFMIKDIQYELRRMAVTVTGIPIGTNHPSENWAEQHLWSSNSNSQRTSTMQLPDPSKSSIPMPPTIEYDDVAIHFRCGDIVDTDDTRYGLMKFTSIPKYISPEAKSIGILTQPFETGGSQEREVDSNQHIHDRCRKIVYALQDFLQTNNKNAQVSIRNDRNETIAVTYSRLIMANQTIVSTSSFGVLAGLASFGTSYILNTDYKEGPNRWLLNPNIMTLTDNVILIDEPILFGKTIKEHWWDGTEAGEKVLDWLLNDEAELNATIEHVHFGAK